MKFTETRLKGAYIIEIEKFEDNRGFFARTFCEHEFKDKGLNTKYVQSNISFNKKRGTLRGMHMQVSPYSEIKLVRCIRGAIFDVVIDLRKESRTYSKWISVELTAEDHQMLYVPEGFAHGYQTLQYDTEIHYQVSDFYEPKSEQGVRYDDPAFGINWPLDVSVISEKDANWPNFEK